LREGGAGENSREDEGTESHDEENLSCLPS
jgi:hypothetical protein